MDDQAAAILKLLFQAPGERDAWWLFFEALGAAISPDIRVVLLAESTEPVPYTVLFGAGVQREAAGILPRRRGGKERVDALPLGAVFELPPLGALGRNPVVRSLLEPEGLLPGPGIGAVLARDGTWVVAVLLVLPQHRRWAPTTADHALLAQIAPFLPQAVRLHQRLLGADALTSILDYLVLGVLLLDANGRVTYANRSAAELLGVSPGLSEPSERGVLDPRSEALYRAVPRERNTGEGLYHHPMDGRPLHVLTTALSWPNRRGSSARRFASAVFVGDPKQGSGDPAGNLGRMYELTPGESRLAWLLVGDFSLAEAAEHLRITESTARTVLRRILSKTGTRRQASLVRLLLSGPGQLRDDAKPLRRGPPRTRRRRS